MSDTDKGTQLNRLFVVAVVVLPVAVLGWLLFVEYPGNLADLLGILLVIGLVVLVVRFAGHIAARKYPDYNVAEVTVEGPISRDGGGSTIPSRPGGATADEIVEQVEAAGDDDAVDGLLVHLNTPGGEVVPSDDIRNAVAAFDGPTVAYATDVCASGGYWIASGCDELWAREPSIVGSIGVIGSRPNAAGLAEKLGISYEQFTAGEFKDAGTPLKEIDADERAYLQSLIDGLYDHFVERVAAGREMDEAFVRETEARVYLGDEAHDLGLVDHLGDHDDVEGRMETLLGTDVSVQAFEPQRSPFQRIGFGARRVAYALGAGVASQFNTDEDGVGFDLRT
jgi:protease-4